MRHFLVMLVVGLLTLGPAMDYAEARRMGGGGNVGSFSRSADRPAAAPNQAAPARQGQSQAAGGSRMPGMLGGLLAGGLLAALFFGGAFDELRMMDILLVAGLAFLLFRLFARRRPALASQAPAQRVEAETQEQPQAFQADTAPLGAGSRFGGDPEWFDRERFLGGAKEHFMTLQRAWDNNDFAGIQEYVTPALYNQLRQERANHPANNRTEIVRLFAELGDVREVGSQAEATVIFHGILEENGEQTEFNETWHLIRELRDDAPWYLQGIEQNPAT
ncbi:Tim44 domain-containing protein [Halomonas campisalis]|uniref:Tim44 domain-containing protein n=1 Tax=Billgrantia campisalis TaxID=74661 RepID=A0ABS9P8Z3_9GAMM|nr:Tim44-like domain-containing protein [Halomonas campisalis]MCG6658243.1 Tim44 domain-containing protein [Halomonas campisalis]MDR5862911.1 Tim44-like domain-containing protein [Halomonas campisalis]